MQDLFCQCFPTKACQWDPKKAANSILLISLAPLHRKRALNHAGLETIPFVTSQWGTPSLVSVLPSEFAQMTVIYSFTTAKSLSWHYLFSFMSNQQEWTLLSDSTLLAVTQSLNSTKRSGAASSVLNILETRRQTPLSLKQIFIFTVYTTHTVYCPSFGKTLQMRKIHFLSLVRARGTTLNGLFALFALFAFGLW